MVSVGTIFSLALVGALGVGIYAVYSNAGTIGNALSRGIQKNVSNPLGNYFGNLWQGIDTNSQNIQNSQLLTQQKLDYERLKNIQQQQQQYQQLYGQSITSWQDTLSVFQKQYESWRNSSTNGGTVNPVVEKLPESFPGEEHRNRNPQAPPNEPLFSPSPSGYYYQDFAPNGRADRQIKLKVGTADKLRKRGFKLYFLTPSTKLSAKSFQLYGKSKGYL